MGGAFVIRAGEAKIHVMPDFSATPLQSDKDVEEWLRFYQCHAPLTCLSTFVSHDPVRMRMGRKEKRKRREEKKRKKRGVLLKTLSHLSFSFFLSRACVMLEGS
jgi:hypothetical protein